MGVAARKATPRLRTPIPMLTQEYAAGIPEFAVRFFQQLSRRCATIVLDNYHEIPENSPFHDMMSAALASLAEGVRVVVISRARPPSALVRLASRGLIAQVRDQDLRFSLDESWRLARKSAVSATRDQIRDIHQRTAGWAAGMILLLEQRPHDDVATPPRSTYDGIFNFFAGHVFSGIDPEEREFLLKTSFLPDLNINLADRLSGGNRAERILSRLYSRHFFTEKPSDSGQDYRYHPLFREFLHNRAKSVFTPERITTIRREAALLLEQYGRREDAARLYAEAEDLEGLRRIIVHHSRELLSQGRGRIVEEWLDTLPSDFKENDPWLLYWGGMSVFPADMSRARSSLEKALFLFRLGEDSTGGYLAWAGIIDTHAYGFDQWRHLDDCIEQFDGLLKRWPVFPSAEIELIASSRMLISLTLRKTSQPEWVHDWLRRVTVLLQENPSLEIQIDTRFCMSIYYLWKGEYERNGLLLERAAAELRHRQPAPFIAIRMKLMRGIHYWVTADYDSAISTLAEGLELSRTSGVRVFESLLWGFMAAAEMAPGRLDRAGRLLENQMASLMGLDTALDSFFFHVNSAWHALLTFHPCRAAEHLEVIAARVTNLGTPYYQTLWFLGMAQVDEARELRLQALDHARAAHRISLEMKSQVMEWYSLMILAWILFRLNRDTEGLDHLRAALALGERHGYAHLEFYQPTVMGRLYARALAERIKPDHVRRQIRALSLTPPVYDREDADNLCAHLDAWPFPVKIITMGRFEILKNGEPLVFSGKEQKRPLELLKTLITFGGGDVPKEYVIDALWPDIEGDLASKSLDTTLSRLRRLLGGDNLILYRGGSLTINPLYCRVDSIVLGRLLHHIEECDPEHDDGMAPGDRALALHRGPFLPGDARHHRTTARRETLRNGVLRIALRAGRHHERAGNWDRAIGYYTRGIAIDCLAEEFYRRLMICQRQLGNYSDAVRTYQRCRDLLRDELNIAPSPRTTAIYTAIIKKR